MPYVLCVSVSAQASLLFLNGLNNPTSFASRTGCFIYLLDHLNVQTANFCGISMGGLTGQWLTNHQPERFIQIAV